MRIVTALVLAGLVSLACSAGSDETLDRETCLAARDILQDASDRVDTLAETRERLRDLLDDLGRFASPDIQEPLRRAVSAVTTLDPESLGSALDDLVAACEQRA
ncbi:MAG: hypothetical protein KatS3mg013_1191 [Actinomycetota bacterium]|nr:MAG: hypothetical protein KatS3mg013_1191 [Actinomycetota bacterium]